MRDHTGERLTSRRALKAMTTLFAAVALLFVSVLPAWAAASMTLTFVRHAESDGNVAGAGIDTKVPGPNLTNPTGLQQAADIAQVLAGNPVNYHGIYVSEMVRTSQTAAPLFQTAKYQGQSATVLPGVREISAGIFEGSPVDSGLGRIGYFLIPLTWTLGLRSIPIPGGENGNGFEARVNESIATIEANGDTTPLVFSHGATIMIWTMMNVKNPDLGLLLSDPLPNTGVVVVTGNLEDGWTLVSYDGKAVDPNPGLVTQLFVNTRDLIATPQTALYNVVQAIKTGDLGKVIAAVRDGVVTVAKAGVTFVKNTVTDVAHAIVGALPGSAQSTAATTVAAVQSDAPAADRPSSEANDSTRAVTETANGATDLSDGNKAEPARPGVGAANSRTGSSQAVADRAAETSSAADKGGDTAKKRSGSARHSAEKAAA